MLTCKPRKGDKLDYDPRSLSLEIHKGKTYPQRCTVTWIDTRKGIAACEFEDGMAASFLYKFSDGEFTDQFTEVPK